MSTTQPQVSVIPRPAVAAGGPQSRPLATVEQLYDDEYEDVETAEDVIEIPSLAPCPGPPPPIGFRNSYPYVKIMTGAQLMAEYSDQFFRMMRPGLKHTRGGTVFNWQIGLNVHPLNTGVSNGSGLYFAHASSMGTYGIHTFGQKMHRVRVPPNSWVIAESAKGWFRSGAVYLEELTLERATAEEKQWIADVLAVERDLTAYHRLPTDRRTPIVTQQYWAKCSSNPATFTLDHWNYIPTEQQRLCPRPCR